MGALTDYLTNNRVGAFIGDTLTKKVLPFVSDVITSPIGKVISAADKAFEEVVREPLSGSFLQETYQTNKGYVETLFSIFSAKQKAEKSRATD